MNHPFKVYRYLAYALCYFHGTRFLYFAWCSILKVRPWSRLKVGFWPAWHIFNFEEECIKREILEDMRKRP